MPVAAALPDAARQPSDGVVGATPVFEIQIGVDADPGAPTAPQLIVSVAPGVTAHAVKNLYDPPPPPGSGPALTPPRDGLAVMPTYMEKTPGGTVMLVPSAGVSVRVVVIFYLPQNRHRQNPNRVRCHAIGAMKETPQSPVRVVHRTSNRHRGLLHRLLRLLR